MAATGTPTPNIGLRRPQGTDPASVDDINYNSNLIDTKLGPVGNTSVQAQINSLNSNLANKLKKIGSQLKIYTLNNLNSIECFLVYGAGGSQSAFMFMVAVQPSNNSVKSYDIITSNFYQHTEEYVDGTLTITFTGSDSVYSGLYILNMRG